MSAATGRGTIDGLETAQPLGHLLPAMFMEDELAQRFTGALDEVLAPVLVTLDNLAAHLDPALAPPDFVTWMAQWVGLVVDETWSTERLRELVAGSVELYRWRGTARGLRGLLEVYLGVEAEVIEPGGAAGSPVPGGAAPGVDGGTVVVRVKAKKGTVDEGRLEALVAAAIPAHLQHHVEVSAR